jgi:hypothetical protein
MFPPIGDFFAPENRYEKWAKEMFGPQRVAPGFAPKVQAGV